MLSYRLQNRCLKMKNKSMYETNLAQTHKWCTFQFTTKYKIIRMFHAATISTPVHRWCLCTANQPVTPAGVPGHHAALPLRMPMCYQKWETEQAHVNTKTVHQKHLTHIHHQKSRPQSAFFLNTFLSLMYLQALICSVSLKYYKHFSDHGHLNFFFLSCIFARYHLNVSGLFVYRPTCIASWVYTTASCEAYVHY